MLAACIELLDDRVDKNTTKKLTRGQTPEHYIADVYVGLDPRAVCIRVLHKYGPFGSPKSSTAPLALWELAHFVTHNWHRR